LVVVGTQLRRGRAVLGSCLLDRFHVLLRHLPHLGLGEGEHLAPRFAGLADDALVERRARRRQLGHDQWHALWLGLRHGGADTDPDNATNQWHGVGGAYVSLDHKLPIMVTQTRSPTE